MEEHQYALDACNRWVDARTTPYTRGAEYRCDCPQRHRLKHVKPKHRMHYFAHIVSGTKRRPWETVRCGAGGESMQHRLAKHRLRENINAVSFAMEECPMCGRQLVMNFADCSVRLEMRSEDHRWRYDCLVYDTDDRPFYALEVVHSHFSGEDKASSTRDDGLEIAEFLAEEVLLDETCSNHRLRNLLMIRRDCYRCSYHMARAQALEADIQTIQDFEALCLQQLLAEHGDRQFEQKLSRGSEIQKAILAIQHFQHLISVDPGRPPWPNLALERARRSATRGFVIDVAHTTVPADEMFLLVTDRAWDGTARVLDELKDVWHFFSICRDLVLATTADTVLARLPVLRKGERVTLRSCLFPLLTKLEDELQLCAACGVYGHRYRHCRHAFCSRCGRGGHRTHKCFAKTTMNGRVIEA